MIVYLENFNGEEICFKHAVKAAIEKGENISLKGYDDSDCGESGAWHLGSCVECNKERDEDDSF